MHVWLTKAADGLPAGAFQHVSVADKVQSTSREDVMANEWHGKS